MARLFDFDRIYVLEFILKLVRLKTFMLDNYTLKNEFETTDFVWMIKYKGFCGYHTSSIFLNRNARNCCLHQNQFVLLTIL
jgi:hypothetical protein